MGANKDPGRCQAEHPIKVWPYVQRCRDRVQYRNVHVEPLDKRLDLCGQDFWDYHCSLPASEAAALVQDALDQPGVAPA